MKDMAMPSAEDQFRLLTFLHRVCPGRSLGVNAREADSNLVAALIQALPERDLHAPPNQVSAASLPAANAAQVLGGLAALGQRGRAEPRVVAEAIQDGTVFALLRRLRQVVASGPALSAKVVETFDQYCRAVETIAPELVDQPGSLIYSPPDTLQPAPLMLLGTNPGNAPEPWTATIREELSFRRQNTDYHAYVRNLTGEDHQLSVSLQAIVRMAGLEMRRVPAFNLMPSPTKEAKATNYPGEAQAVWPIHLFAIKAIMPRVLLCFGNGAVSPYGFLREFVARQVREGETLPIYGTFSIKQFSCTVGGVEVTVLGMPHPSRCRVLPKNEALAGVLRALIG